MTSDHHWQVLLLKGPQKILRKLPADVRNRLLAALHGLEKEPYPAGVKKLTGYESYFRIRVGDWRIIYTVEAIASSFWYWRSALVAGCIRSINTR